MGSCDWGGGGCAKELAAKEAAAREQLQEHGLAVLFPLPFFTGPRSKCDMYFDLGQFERDKNMQNARHHVFPCTRLKAVTPDFKGSSRFGLWRCGGHFTGGLGGAGGVGGYSQGLYMI